MTQENEVEEGKELPADAPEVETPENNEPSAEDRARRMGWVPKDEFRGDPDRWVDADKFIERGENELPILRERLRNFEKTTANLERTLKDLAEHHTRTEQRAYQRALTDLRKQQREAAAKGDIGRFDEIDQEMANLVKEVRQPQTQQQMEVEPEVKEWAKKNRWFREDPDMAAFATSYHGTLLQTKPGLTLEENLEEVEKAVKKAFPEKFTNPRRTQPSQVEGGSQPRGKGGKGYSDLPPDAKQACDRFVKQGIMTKDQYVKEFFAE